MASFTGNTGLRDPFGNHEFLRSTVYKTRSATCSALNFPTITIDGTAGKKRLYKGTVMASITSGADAGKVGPFAADATDGRQTLTNIVGISGTYLPEQLNTRDVEIAIVYDASVVQAWCYEYAVTNNGGPIALTDTTRDAFQSTTTTHILFN